MYCNIPFTVLNLTEFAKRGLIHTCIQFFDSHAGCVTQLVFDLCTAFKSTRRFVLSVHLHVRKIHIHNLFTNEAMPLQSFKIRSVYKTLFANLVTYVLKYSVKLTGLT